MAGDMVLDMELDQQITGLNGDFDSQVTREQLANIRAYLSWFYAVSRYLT